MIRAEFTIYPFTEGERPPAHAEAALQRLRDRGLEVEVGLLSQSVTGSVDDVLGAMTDALRAAVEAGASRIVVSVEVAGGG